MESYRVCVMFTLGAAGVALCEEQHETTEVHVHAFGTSAWYDEPYIKCHAPLLEIECTYSHPALGILASITVRILEPSSMHSQRNKATVHVLMRVNVLYRAFCRQSQTD